MDGLPSGIPTGDPSGLPAGLPGINISFPPGLKESYIAAFLESMIYGAYLPVFLECLIVLRRRKLANPNHWYLVATTVSMFGLITARCIYEVHACITTFNGLRNLLSSVQSSAFFIELDYAFLIAISDGFLLFRTFVVWDRSWTVIILPVLLYLASCGTSIYSLVVLKSVGPAGDVIGQNVINPGDIFLIMTLCMNLLCTGLISFRIIRSYQVPHVDLNGSASKLPWSRPSVEGMKIVSVLIESAAINTCLSVGLLVTTRLNSLVSFILSDCSSPTIGLVFSLIVVRVGRGTSYGDSNGAHNSSSLDNGMDRMNFELNSRLARSELEVQLTLEDHHQGLPRRRAGGRRDEDLRPGSNSKPGGRSMV